MRRAAPGSPEAVLLADHVHAGRRDNVPEILTPSMRGRERVPLVACRFASLAPRCRPIPIGGWLRWRGVPDSGLAISRRRLNEASGVGSVGSRQRSARNGRSRPGGSGNCSRLWPEASEPAAPEAAFEEMLGGSRRLEAVVTAAGVGGHNGDMVATDPPGGNRSRGGT